MFLRDLSMTSVYQEKPENGYNTPQEIKIEDTQAVSSNQLNAIEQHFKSWRKQWKGITHRMRQVQDWEILLKVTVAEIQEKIACDRAFIYQFTSADSGVVSAEYRNPDWTPMIGEVLPAILFGLSASQYYLEAVGIDDIAQTALTPYQSQLLEKFQIKAILSLPIVVKGEVWGLLVVNNCAKPREWQESELSLLYQIASELNHKLDEFEFQKKLEQQAQEQKSVSRILEKIQRSSNLDKIFETTTKELRQLLQCDRLAIYRFNSDWSGEFVAESVAEGWVKLVGTGIKTVWEDTHLQETQGGRYRSYETFVVNDIYEVGHAPCHVDILEQFEIRAYMIVPVFAGKKLWGLLAAYQNSGTRDWQTWEVNLLNQFGVNFGVAISQVEYIQQTEQQSERLTRTAQRQQNLITLTRKIGEALTEKVESTEINGILQTTAAEVRRLLQVDRTVVYRFNPDWSGEFVAESVGKGWIPFREQSFDRNLLRDNGDCETFRGFAGLGKVKDTYLQENEGGRYRQKSSCVVDDISQAGFPVCYTELLEQFEAKAYITVPIFKQNKLWGLLASYQNSAPRHWEEFEVNVMQQIAVLLGVAMQQSETVEQLQRRSEEVAKAAERDRAVGKVIDRIRQSLDIDSIFNTTTKEVRTLLSADRVAVYQFNPDWSGLFVSESVSPQWNSLIDKQYRIERLQESVSVCKAMQSLIATSKQQTADTYLQDTQGGELKNRKAYVIADIYQAGFSDCYIEVLEQYQARSYAIVPIFQGQQLWGMLAAYQNSGSRQWEQPEVGLLGQIADQLGVALLQAEYLKKLETQSLQVTEAAGREKAAKEVLQKGAMQLLSAVRPALNGDLTVRAPITEDELGTIADAYNNTLQALRQIVIQVQAAAQQVAQTSANSNASLTGLTHLAEQQSQEISDALDEIQQMVDSTQYVAANAEAVQAAVQQANETVESGDAAMNLTVEAIQAIRETVAQTSKKIKRLSESSQKISKVVNLISSFATQTNVLALNAAIEATRAGEYGKGFAVVADEVRSLSRQSAAATIEIEKLVQEIQQETGEVALAMETGIQQVVEGTNLVSETRLNLNAIVAATAEISQLLQRITDSTQGQMLQSVSATASMKDIANIANRTSTEAHQIAVVFQQLSQMAQELLASASKFKVD
jgi:methyl-accepting chemotaxis protein PixJ